MKKLLAVMGVLAIMNIAAVSAASAAPKAKGAGDSKSACMKKAQKVKMKGGGREAAIRACG